MCSVSEKSPRKPQQTGAHFYTAKVTMDGVHTHNAAPEKPDKD